MNKKIILWLAGLVGLVVLGVAIYIWALPYGLCLRAHGTDDMAKIYCNQHLPGHQYGNYESK